MRDKEDIFRFLELVLTDYSKEELDYLRKEVVEFLDKMKTEAYRLAWRGVYERI